MNQTFWELYGAELPYRDHTADEVEQAIATDEVLARWSLGRALAIGLRHAAALDGSPLRAAVVELADELGISVDAAEIRVRRAVSAYRRGGLALVFWSWARRDPRAVAALFERQSHA